MPRTKKNNKPNIPNIPRTILFVFSELCKNGVLPSAKFAVYQLSRWGINVREVAKYAAALLGKVWAAQFADAIAAL